MNIFSKTINFLKSLSLTPVNIVEKPKKFINAWFCVDCNNELTYHEVMYSHGRCPKCGFKGKSAGTIIDTYEKGVYK